MEDSHQGYNAANLGAMIEVAGPLICRQMEGLVGATIQIGTPSRVARASQLSAAEASQPSKVELANHESI